MKKVCHPLFISFPTFSLYWFASHFVFVFLKKNSGEVDDDGDDYDDWVDLDDDEDDEDDDM